MPTDRHRSSSLAESPVDGALWYYESLSRRRCSSIYQRLCAEVQALPIPPHNMVIAAVRRRFGASKAADSTSDYDTFSSSSISRRLYSPYSYMEISSPRFSSRGIISYYRILS